MSSQIQETFAKYKVIPVISIPNEECIEPLGDILEECDLPIAEITLRTNFGLKAIESLSKRSQLLVGAGTVTTANQVDQVLHAGGKFIVSPGLLESVVTQSISKSIPIFPGVITPSEIMLALSLGLKQLKFFPAETFGGANAIKSLGGPFADVSFIPTGGITTKNIQDYLKMKNVLACGGTWLAPNDLLASGKFNEIKKLIVELKEIIATLS